MMTSSPKLTKTNYVNFKALLSRCHMPNLKTNGKTIRRYRFLKNRLSHDVTSLKTIDWWRKKDNGVSILQLKYSLPRSSTRYFHLSTCYFSLLLVTYSLLLVTYSLLLVTSCYFLLLLVTSRYFLLLLVTSCSSF